MQPRRLFIAGSTGAVGKTLLPLAEARGVAFLAHRRPKPGAVADAKTAVFELTDSTALKDALAQCTTVLQLIGTMKNRFAKGDTYESSDIGTTQCLVDAARAAGSIDHLVLLSSVGAGG